MKEKFDIQSYMINGVFKIVKEPIKAALKKPKESLFLASFMTSVNRASEKRNISEKNVEHIPPFLIASITSNCNLHCAGCYSRCNNATTDSRNDNLLSREDWKKIFKEANEIGISFILLAGGEPLLSVHSTMLIT